MVRSYFQIALRMMLRYRSYTMINVLGLSVGIGSALILFHVLRIHMGFDSFHAKKDRIFRIVTDSDDNGRLNQTQGTPLPMGPALEAEFPQIDRATRTFYVENGLVTIMDHDGAPTKYRETTGLAFVEPDLFSIFDFSVLSGSVSALAEPFTVVLGRTMALKYFGGSEAIGRTIRYDNKHDFRIVAVVEDFPSATDLPFSVMMSMESGRSDRNLLYGSEISEWRNIASVTNTWILLQEGTDPQDLERQLPAFNVKHYNDPHNDRIYRVQPLREVHFAVDYGSYSNLTTGRATLVAMALIAIFLVLTACINFVNLATAQAVRRAREVGVRKILGARRVQVTLQFLGETFLITALSVTMAVGLCELLLPGILSALQLESFQPGLSSPDVMVFLLVLTVVVTIVSGLYPGILLSGFRPIQALKAGSSRSARGGMLLRRSLVVLQFVISQVLVVATIVAVTQLDYLRSKNLGFDGDAIVTVPLPVAEPTKLETLRNRLLEHSAVRGVTHAFAVGAANHDWNTMMSAVVSGREERVRVNMRVADPAYIPTLGLQLLAGRTHLHGDTLSEMVVNEAFLSTLGIASPQDAIGWMIQVGRRRIPIVGVVKDWNTASLHEPIRPTVIGNHTRQYQEAGIKIEMADSRNVLAHIERVWNEVFPEYVFSSEFLDERVGKFYQRETLISNMFKSFAGVAIAIGCLGLFGLVAFMVNQKTKEIGIRKVLGASVTGILGMFAGEFVKLIALAFIVAAPVAYFAMQRWLEDFEYRIAIGAGVFAAAICVSLLVAAVTVGYQVIRAATANPVKALRYE